MNPRNISVVSAVDSTNFDEKAVKCNLASYKDQQALPSRNYDSDCGHILQPSLSPLSIGSIDGIPSTVGSVYGSGVSSTSSPSSLSLPSIENQKQQKYQQESSKQPQEEQKPSNAPKASLSSYEANLPSPPTTRKEDVFVDTPPKSRDPDHGPVGCYLVYDSSAGGRLMLYYSEGPVPENAVGFWCPGPTKRIQGFKFKQGVGRSELIKGIAGGDSNRRKYFIGWCQFCKLAKSYNGKIIQFVPATQGVAVDVYGYTKFENQPVQLDLDRLTDISMYDAVAVMPKHHEFLKGVKSIGMTQFFELGNIAGATTLMN